MRKFFLLTMTGVFAIGAAGALAACGSDSNNPEDAIREAITDGDIDFDDDSITIGDGDNSTTFGGCSELPEGFPTDEIPLPDETPQSCTRTVSDGDAYFSISWEGDIFDDIKSNLEGGSFSIQSEGETDSNGNKSKYATMSSDDWQVSLSLNVYSDEDYSDTTTSISVFTNTSSDF